MSLAEKTNDPAPDMIARSSAATRVDAAHVRQGESVSGDFATFESEAGQAMMSATAPQLSVVATIQQVRAQAAQLAAHLQRQQATVDHREAELNARLAGMETEIRGARLWLNERHAELAQQKTDLDRRAREIAQNEAALNRGAKGDRGRSRPAEHWATDEAQHLQRNAELDRREAELDAMRARLAAQFSAGEQAQDIEQAMRALETREKNLDRAEALLAGEQSQLERARRQLAEERARHAQTAQAERQRLAEGERRTIAQHDRIRRDLARQSDELAARHAALERMRADIARSQQEALEMRLATEELWARLCGTMAPAALTQSLAQIRLKLAEEQRLARDELARQKTELNALGARVAQQHGKLAREREELQTWAVQRQKELEKNSGVLVAAQQRIDEERSAFHDESAQWQEELARLQAEIRRLLRQAHRVDGVAA